jgi:hypothetical protein
VEMIAASKAMKGDIVVGTQRAAALIGVAPCSGYTTNECANEHVDAGRFDGALVVYTAGQSDLPPTGPNRATTRMVAEENRKMLRDAAQR